MTRSGRFFAGLFFKTPALRDPVLVPLMWSYLPRTQTAWILPEWVR